MQDDNQQPQTTSNPISSSYDSSSAYAHPTEVQPATSDASSEYAPIGLTGSQIKQQKVPLPIGIYIIAGFNLAGFVIGFIDTSQNSELYTFVLFIDLILAIGLLFRLEVARKIIIWLTSITLVLTLVSIFLLIGLQRRLQTLKTNYEAAVSQINQSSLTPTQQQALAAMQSTIAADQKQSGKAITLTYIKLGATTAETIGVIFYLTRPKVKGVFIELED